MRRIIETLTEKGKILKRHIKNLENRMTELEKNVEAQSTNNGESFITKDALISHIKSMDRKLDDLKEVEDESILEIDNNQNSIEPEKAIFQGDNNGGIGGGTLIVGGSNYK